VVLILVSFHNAWWIRGCFLHEECPGMLLFSRMFDPSCVSNFLSSMCKCVCTLHHHVHGFCKDLSWLVVLRVVGNWLKTRLVSQLLSMCKALQKRVEEKFGLIEFCCQHPNFLLHPSLSSTLESIVALMIKNQPSQLRSYGIKKLLCPQVWK
jgi:hypothetical protein